MLRMCFGYMDDLSAMKFKLLSIRFVIATCLLLASLAHAEDLGVFGTVSRPDPDGRAQLKEVFQQKYRTGEVDAFWKTYQAKTIEAIKHPAPLGVRSSYEFSSELINLKYVTPIDFKDETGKVIVRRGTVIEPLKLKPLAFGLIFIDGRDQRQINYAIARSAKDHLKIVLTAGSAFDLRVRYKDVIWLGGKSIPFYFDQRKMIINSLKANYGINIDHVPAALFQKGSQLELDFGLQS